MISLTKRWSSTTDKEFIAYARNHDYIETMGCDRNRGFFRVLSQIASPVVTIRRIFGENLWNLAKVVVSLQCR
jgi:hypothetical protein